MDTPQRTVVIASLLIITAELCFAGVSALVKYLSTYLPSEQLVFFRNLMAFLVLLPWLWRKGPSAFKTKAWKFHLSRGLAGLAAMYLFFYAIAHLPLAQATLVLLLSPFIIPIIGRLWLHEKVLPQTWLAIGIGFIGVFIFLNPTTATLSPVVAVAFIAACLAAFTKTLIRQMSATESSSKIVFYFASLATLLSALPLVWMGQAVAPEHWLAIVVMGALAVAGQLTMTKAFAMAPAARVGVFTYSSVIFAALMGYWFWQEPITLSMLIGAGVIMVAGYLAIRTRRQA
ncbi:MULTISPECIES: DMT family transporter [Idiomarina]|uniref:DMT family transporter n=1 Tax=Idiomarina TaxID=135575 RepID=UPI00129BB5FD|nr:MULTISPECIES: DMT family transporter [Idiomarina]MRJ41020.1 EamA family transporter [Idiomarina sp. FeN1]NCU56185.1 EamA family transporter [Idiomarina sp. FenA--70]NCU59204.1 EamA family transporter [Idiomarina sp. FenBw--71]UUN14876.1 DMT family transporter [Idiomarina loihiensis]